MRLFPIDHPTRLLEKGDRGSDAGFGLLERVPEDEPVVQIREERYAASPKLRDYRSRDPGKYPRGRGKTEGESRKFEALPSVLECQKPLGRRSYGDVQVRILQVLYHPAVLAKRLPSLGQLLPPTVG